MVRSRLPRAIALGLLPALVGCLALGCGGDKTYRVSGKVTFKGQPIPAGRITFTPDNTKGNKGPAGYAEIKGGQYDTSATGGRGTVGGAMNVMIEGYDPSAAPDKAAKSGEGTMKPLFPRYDTKADLPAGDTTKDFDVPADAVKGPKKEAPKGP
jgi:hypothetical protein